jgi:hypothetical protein
VGEEAEVGGEGVEGEGELFVFEEVGGGKGQEELEGVGFG